MELCEARPTDGWCNAATVHSGSASIATPRDVYTRLAPGTSSSAAVGAVYPPVQYELYIESVASPPRGPGGRGRVFAAWALAYRDGVVDGGARGPIYKIYIC